MANRDLSARCRLDCFELATRLLPDFASILGSRSQIGGNENEERMNLKRLTGLWRDTWWIWVIFVAQMVALGVYMSKYFLLPLMGLPISYAYFAFMRYDEDGNEKSE